MELMEKGQSQKDLFTLAAAIPAKSE
jgi:hypothetical protein